MRIPFLILLLNICVAASGTVYYIDPAGSDANNGSSGSPWKTLAYACSKVKTAGDIIHVNSGTYTERSQSSLAVGVSIEGEGLSSNIISNVSSVPTYTIILDASTEATNGNQHISGIRMDGNSLTAYGAISVAYRKNVEISNCTFVDFKYYGVSFINGEPPSVYATGNKFHDNTVTNCSGFFSGNCGALEIGGQDGMLIYNNTMTQDRSNGLNGDIIYGVAGYLKNVKIYNNVLNKTYIPGTTDWDFSIEFWNCQGGVEIYNNTVNGSIDLVNSVKGSSDYSVWVHDNEIGQSVLLSSESTRGILLEASQSDVIIERNNIKNISSGILFSQVQSARVLKNIHIRCNIFNNIGVSDAGASNKGWGIYWTAESYKNHTVDNVNICNNILIGHSGARATMWGINLPHIGTASNITLRNNIIQNFNYAPVYAYSQTGSETIDILSIENNIFYQNGNNNAPKYSSITPTNNTTKNNLTSNPLFISSSDFHLQSGSPAIGKGIKATGVTLDFDGNGFNDPPSIGAYEFDVPVVPVYKSSSVENATPSSIGMTFNLSLANIVPATSAFSVMVNSVTRTVNSVSVSGNIVQLTLAGPIVYGDLVTVTYVVPGSNPLQTASGSQAAAFSVQRVTNNVTPILPVYTASSIENANPALLVITYNMALANVTPAASAFIVSVNSSARSVSKVTVTGSTVQLTLANPVIYGDVVTIAYTKPSSNPLQSASGAQAATLSAQKVTNNVAAGSPVYVSSAIQNAKPNLLEMTYNLNLASVVPAASAFSVVVNSAARTVSTVAISGTKVQLTLSSPVVYGDVVTVAYTKPATNPLQASSGGSQAATISAQKVTNNVSSSNPLYVSSSVENTAPSRLLINYNMALASAVPAASAFSVKVNTRTRTVSSVSVSGTTVQLTLSSAVAYGDAITVAYTKPATNPLQSSSGAQAATYTAQKVTNNVNPVYPVYVSSVVQNANPYLIEMTYSLALAKVVPAASAFSVVVNTVARAVSTVTVSGTKVQLALSSPVVSSDVVTVAYTKPAASQLQTSSGIQAVSLSAQAVTNNTINHSPAVAIISPASNSEFKTSSPITITANAADSDGSIKSVAFYSGATLIGTVTASPYTFIWSNVNAGTYSLTAVATDNLNTKTVSSAITISVTDQAIIANQPPVVMIANPNKGDQYNDPADIGIEVIASDPDGTITKIELYNGSVKIAELTEAPYSYTWKGVSAGNYTIKAVATDNSNAVSTSPTIELLIGNNTMYDPNGDFINLYPNPTSGQITIDVITPLQSDKTEIVFTDLSGNKVYSETIIKEETSKHFDLSHVRPGIYIMSVIDKQVLITKKFMKR
jgi:uncharacterized repeat protein (TIGR02059 family)